MLRNPSQALVDRHFVPKMLLFPIAEWSFTCKELFCTGYVTQEHRIISCCGNIIEILLKQCLKPQETKPFGSNGCPQRGPNFGCRCKEQGFFPTTVKIANKLEQMSLNLPQLKFLFTVLCRKYSNR